MTDQENCRSPIPHRQQLWKRKKDGQSALLWGGIEIQSGHVFEIADDPMVEVTYLNSTEVMRVVEKPISNPTTWEFPAASVSVVELKLT